MAKPLDLLYPIYLDVPMLASFLAAVDDDALETPVTSDESTPEAASLNVQGQLGAANAGGMLAQKHTEASLFRSLHRTLHETDSITVLDNMEQVESLSRGGLIEVKGHIYRNPLIEALEAFTQIMSMSGIDFTGPARPTPINAGAPAGPRRSAGGRPNAAPAAASTATPRLNSEEAGFVRILQSVKDYLASSTVLDALLYPTAVDTLPIILTLSQESLSQGNFESLFSGEFTIIGKVTGLAGANTEVPLYQRSLYSFFTTEIFEEGFENLREIPWIQLPENVSFVQGPAVQVMPLAVFI